VNSDPAKTSSATSAKAEPTALRRAVPVWLIPITLVMIFWGMWYFDSQGGWFNPVVYTPYPDHKTLEVWQPAANTDDPIPRGFKVYNMPACVTCHQADGNGTPGQNPPLVKSDWLKEPEPGRVIRIVLHGLTGSFEVNGKPFNGNMVPWKDTLNDQQIADVLSYVRQNKDFGNNAPIVKPEQVAAIRKKTESRTQPFTPDELLKISPAE
jgi:mono/diheme cytochrome c family protein